MAVTVELVPSVTGLSNPSPEVHQAGTIIDVDFDHLYVYSHPDQVIATYSKGSWLSAVVS